MTRTKHPVAQTDEVRGFGEHRSRVGMEHLDGMGSKAFRHPMEDIEPEPETMCARIRAGVVAMIHEMKPLTVAQRETVFLRVWGAEWIAIAGQLGLASEQAAEQTLRAAIRKAPRLRSLFPHTTVKPKTGATHA